MILLKKTFFAEHWNYILYIYILYDSREFTTPSVFEITPKLEVVHPEIDTQITILPLNFMITSLIIHYINKMQIHLKLKYVMGWCYINVEVISY